MEVADHNESVSVGGGRDGDSGNFGVSVPIGKWNLSLSLFLSFKFPKGGIFACVEQKCPLDSFPFLVYES
jgi:hypothetical protein